MTSISEKLQVLSRFTRIFSRTFLAEAPNRRHYGIMPSRTHKQPKDGRSNLRLSPELWSAIDSARDKRPGNVSRNTWLIEAITEKLAKEQHNTAESAGPHV
jgi:predicted HicB family RNase H-like nuclease